MFKVGDKITCVNVTDRMVEKGATYEVAEIDPRDSRLDTRITLRSGERYWVSSANFILSANNKNKPKFQKGDIVVGNDKADIMYSITSTGCMGVVKEVLNDETIDITLCGGDDGNKRESTYTVDADCFDLVKSRHLVSPVPQKLTIKRVIFNPPATVVIWNDDVKTIVKCGKLDTFDPEKGLAMCVAKRVWGNGYDYYNPFKKYCSKYTPNVDTKKSTKKTTTKTEEK